MDERSSEELPADSISIRERFDSLDYYTGDAGLREFFSMKHHQPFLSRAGATDARVRLLRTILQKLFPTARKIELVPVHNHHGHLRLVASHQGESAKDSCVSLVLIGNQPELDIRSRDFQQLANHMDADVFEGALAGEMSADPL